MNKRIWKKAPAVIGLSLLAVTAFSGVVMLLWNNVLTPVLHVGALSIWQAAGILLLSKILFGGFKGRHMAGGHFMKKRMFMKWENMTPEQREAMKSNWQSCGHYGRGAKCAC